MAAKRNLVDTSRLQFTLDATTLRIIGQMVDVGIHGANKADVASWIIRNWIWDNQAKLAANGIEIVKLTE